MHELYQLVGRLEQSAIDAEKNVDRIDKRLGELDNRLDEVNTTLNELRPILRETSEHAIDWRNTKRKGLLWLAGFGMSGLGIGTVAGKPFLAWLGSLLPILPK